MLGDDLWGAVEALDGVALRTIGRGSPSVLHRRDDPRVAIEPARGEPRSAHRR